MTRAFFDSNVLLYAAGHDADKAATSERLFARGGVISVQVLNEIAHVSRRKFHYDWDRVATFLGGFEQLLQIVPLTIAIQRQGLGIAQRYRLALYDSMIVAAALIADCDILYSEDMHDGLDIDGRLRIENPFAQTPR